MDEGELLDVLNPNGTPTGERKARAAVHRDGDLHRAFHLWIVKEGRYVLLQRRSQHKDLEPNKLDVTVGGHFGAGETIQEVLRETEEEIGLTVTPSEIHHLETRRVERTYPNAIDREIQEVYVMRCDRPLNEYFLLPKEVYVLYEVPLLRALALYRDGAHVAAAGYDCYGRNNDALLVKDDTIEQARADTARVLELVRGWLEHTS